jgi:hypothetical protein
MFGWEKKSDKALPAAPTDEFPGEAEKVVKIKNLCWLAKGSAESINGLSEADLKDEFNEYELTRYRKLLFEATNLARELRDEFYRDAALHLLIGLLMTAGDEAQAKKLYSVIEVDTIQDAVLKEYPRLGAKF